MERMTFGRYLGTRVCDLPDRYLRWLGSLPDLREPLKSCVQEEIADRNAERDAFYDATADIDSHRLSLHVPLKDVELLANLINAGYRALSLRLHPDQGGSNEQQQRLNMLVEELRCVLREGAERAQLAGVADG